MIVSQTLLQETIVIGSDTKAIWFQLPSVLLKMSSEACFFVIVVTCWFGFTVSENSESLKLVHLVRFFPCEIIGNIYFQ